MNFEKTTLKNGLRIVAVPVPRSPSATAMVLVGVGARHEPKNLLGISHFIEHNVFKGTKNRPRRNQVAKEIEGLGGEMNASTGHDYTSYFAKAAASKIKTVLDVVMDISLNMTFPKKDLEIERGNVVEEINMYQDNPPARLLQDFLQFVWDGHPVSQKILGKKETIRTMTRGKMLKFVHKNYSPQKMVVVVAGDFNKDDVLRQVRDCCEGAVRREFSPADVFAEFQKAPRVYLDTDKTEQTHLCLGFKSFGRQDPRRCALDLLNAVLGQGLSSRLFQKIRDELGLAYYVGSENWEFEETGFWFARAGVSTAKAGLAVSAILAEFGKLAEKRVGGSELRKAKEFVKGQTLLAAETSDQLAGWYGFRELFGEEALSPEEYGRRIEALTAGELRSVAGDLWRRDRLNLGVVGPFAESDWRRFLKLLA